MHRIPIWSVAGLCECSIDHFFYACSRPRSRLNPITVFASSVIPPSPLRPNLLYRLGFGAIFSGAGYVLFAGDGYNGSGITTGMCFPSLNCSQVLSEPLRDYSMVLDISLPQLAQIADHPEECAFLNLERGCIGIFCVVRLGIFPTSRPE